MEVNAGYKIQSRVKLDNDRCYVIGYDEKNKCFPYATWRGAFENGKWTYFWGHYLGDLQSALNDLGKRISKPQYMFNTPTLVRFQCEHDQNAYVGIGYQNEVIDLYDGDVYKLHNQSRKIEIIEIYDWVDMDEYVDDRIARMLAIEAAEE